MFFLTQLLFIMVKQLLKGFVWFAVMVSVSLVLVGSAPNGNDLPEWIEKRARPLSTAADLEVLLDIAGSRRLVLLGEASHGTREYYAWRDSISRRLIAEHGFRFIAVEGDWASLYELNRYVKHWPGAAESARNVLEGLDRWPQWMWGNEEIVALAEWLREHNAGRSPDKMVGFYGKDVYDEMRSMEEVIRFLKEHDGYLYERAKSYYDCFSDYQGDSWLYAQAVASGAADCATSAEAVYRLFVDEADRLSMAPGEDLFHGKQNAKVVMHAEQFYRLSATRRDASSWNSRVNHMHLTVNNLLDHYGEGSQGIVWAHNTHIGDARFSEMGQFRQENIGQLARVLHGPEDVFLIGFSTYQGEVKAGAAWGDRRQKMTIPPAREGSIEAYFGQTGLKAFHLIFDDDDRTHDPFMEPRGNRAIGVVYDPRQEARQNYVATIVPLRYDAFLFFRETNALSPLHR